MVSWEHWQTLLAVYRSGTYAAAAATLGINATTVGRRIKLLEQKLGRSLFLRNDGKLIPTSSCSSLLGHLENVSESLRAAELESGLAKPLGLWREVTITAAPFLISNLIAPGVGSLVRNQQLRVELLGTGNNISLARREADIALRIEDGGFTVSSQSEYIVTEQLASLDFAVYSANPDVQGNTRTKRNTTGELSIQAEGKSAPLPWAGLMEDGYASAGMKKMIGLASGDGFQFRTRHFDSLRMMVRSGYAKALLPCFIGDADERLLRISDVELSLPLWMLSHRQDQNLSHLATVRQWIIEWCGRKLVQTGTG